MKHKKKLKGPSPGPQLCEFQGGSRKATPVPPEVKLTRGEAYQR